MDGKFKGIDSLVIKVEAFETELKEIKTHLEAQCTKNIDIMEQTVGKVDTIDFSVGMQEEKTDRLQKDISKVTENMTQGQSKRNNLVFCNIP